MSLYLRNEKLEILDKFSKFKEIDNAKMWLVLAAPGRVFGKTRFNRKWGTLSSLLASWVSFLQSPARMEKSSFTLPKETRTWLIGSRRSVWIRILRLAVIAWPGILPLTRNLWFWSATKLQTNQLRVRLSRRDQNNRPKISPQMLQERKIRKKTDKLEIIRLCSFTV